MPGIPGRVVWVLADEERKVPAQMKEETSASRARAREARWEVDELRLERGRLDDVFRELTAGLKRN